MIMFFKKFIINVCIGGCGGFFGFEIVKIYIGNVCYVFKSVFNDFLGFVVV